MPSPSAHPRRATGRERTAIASLSGTIKRTNYPLATQTLNWESHWETRSHGAVFGFSIIWVAGTPLREREVISGSGPYTVRDKWTWGLTVQFVGIAGTFQYSVTGPPIYSTPYVIGSLSDPLPFARWTLTGGYTVEDWSLLLREFVNTPPYTDGAVGPIYEYIAFADSDVPAIELSGTLVIDQMPGGAALPGGGGTSSASGTVGPAAWATLTGDEFFLPTYQIGAQVKCEPTEWPTAESSASGAAGVVCDGLSWGGEHTRSRDIERSGAVVGNITFSASAGGSGCGVSGTLTADLQMANGELPSPPSALGYGFYPKWALATTVEHRSFDGTAMPAPQLEHFFSGYALPRPTEDPEDIAWPNVYPGPPALPMVGGQQGVWRVEDAVDHAPGLIDPGSVSPAGSFRWPAEGLAVCVDNGVRDVPQRHRRLLAEPLEIHGAGAEAISGLGAAAPICRGNGLGIDPDWASGQSLYIYGTGGTPIKGGWLVGQPFTAARIRFASTHDFGWFDSAGFLDGVWSTPIGSPPPPPGDPTPTFSGGIWTMDQSGTTLRSQWSLPSGERWRCWGFRYYRFQVRSSVQDKQIEFVVVGADGLYNHWYVNVPVANEWYEAEIDLLLPDARKTSAGTDPPTSLNSNPNYLLHPGIFQPTAEAASSGGVAHDKLFFLLDGSTVWDFQGFEGFRKTGNGRVPIRLFGPVLNGSTIGPRVAAQYSDSAAEGHESTPIPSPSQLAAGYQRLAPVGGSYAGFSGGPTFRVVVNGAWAFDLDATLADLLSSGGTPAWTMWGGWDHAQKVYAKSNSGVEIEVTDPNPTPGAPDEVPQMWETDSRTGYAPASLIQNLNGGEWFDVQAQRREGWYGYYGYGDGADYGEELSFVTYDFWNGLLCGNASSLGELVAGAAVPVVDPDTGLPIATPVADGDGFWKVVTKRAVVLALDSAPGLWDYYTNGEDAADRVKYSRTFLTGPNIPANWSMSYTGTGPALRHWWLKQVGEPQDAQLFWIYAEATTAPGQRKRIVVLDRGVSWYDAVGVPGSLGGGVDLARTANNWIFKSYIEDGAVKVARTRTAGATWDTAVTVAGDPASDAVPTLAVDRHDNVFCCYHSAAGSRIYYSTDYGATWTAVATHAGLTHPRAAFSSERMLLLAYDPAVTRQRIYESDDFGATKTLLGSFTAAAAVVGALVVDRGEFIHVYYQTTTNAIAHGYGRAGNSYTVETLVASGLLPSAGLGLANGFLVYWQGGTLHAIRLDSTYSEEAAVIAAPDAEFTQQTLGALVSEAGDYWVAGLDGDAAPQEQYSHDDGVNWDDP